MQPQHTKKRMNFDIFKRSYLSIRRSYFHAKQNAFNLLVDSNNRRRSFVNFWLFNSSFSESFSFFYDVFIIFLYGLRSKAGLPTLLFNQVRLPCHAVRKRRILLSAGYDYPARKGLPLRRDISARRGMISRRAETFPRNVFSLPVVPEYLRAMLGHLPSCRDISARRGMISRRAGTFSRNVFSLPVAWRKHLPLCYDYSIVQYLKYESYVTC